MEILNKLAKYPITVIAVFAFILYAQILTFNLVYCDDVNIIQTDYNRISSISNLPKEFFKGYINTDYYRPIINVSFVLNAAIGGQNTFVYHLSNILFHIIACSLIFYILLNLGYKRTTSLAASLIFAASPIFVNAVAWIPGRNDVIMSIFSFAAFLNIIKFKKTGLNKYVIYNILFYLLAVLSKETALLLPVIFFTYIIFDEQKYNVSIITKSTAGWTIVLLIWFILRSSADLGSNINRFGFDVILMNLSVIPEFIIKFLIPFNLSVLPTYSLLLTLLGTIIILAFLVYAYLYKKLTKKVLFGFLWFLVLLFPTVFVTVSNSNDWNEYLECRSYLPLFGIILLLLNLIPERFRDFEIKLNGYVFIGIIAILSFITITESRNYENELTFYESAVSDSPKQALFNEILGNIYYDKKLYELAEKTYIQMAQDNPTYTKYQLKLGEYYYNRQFYKEAIQPLNKALALDSANKNAMSMLINSYYNDKQYEKAISMLENIYRDVENYPEAVYDLVNIVIETKQYQKASDIAVEFIDAGAERLKFLEIFSKWSNKFYKMGDNVATIRIMEASLKFSPNNVYVLQYLENSYRDAGIPEKAAYYKNMRLQVEKNKPKDSVQGSVQ
jgi:tetratricopeptide (TPR) repeat protein